MMPRTYLRHFQVRQYECDAYSHLHNSHYVRYMQEAAFEASADAGYDLARYNALGHHWIIRETEIEYLKPVYYNEAVQVKTWIRDFRRATSRRAYEFYRQPEGELVAQAYSDWVYLESQTGLAARIPASMQHDFYPEGIPTHFPVRQPIPASSPPPPGVFTHRRKVTWREIDLAQHVNNAVYLDYMDDAGNDVLEAFGWSFQRMEQAGFAIVIRRNQIQYHQPALLDDELAIDTWVSQVRRSTAIRHYAIRRAKDGCLLAMAQAYCVWIDRTSGRPIRIPEPFLADFSDNIVS
jgi:acyl-CoA thioester hydrolase